MCDSKKADESAKKKPDAACDGGVTPCKKGPCPDGCSNIPKIKAKQASYTVVLDKSGNVWAGYPILEFEITDGCPNHYIDIQVAKKDAGLLSGGPGLANAWDKTKLPKDRITQQAYSSWTNGEQALKLDGAGKATYKMPLDWWKDLARQPRNIFITMPVHFRVLAFCDPSTAPLNSSISKVDVLNNLVDFKLTDGGYIRPYAGTVKNIETKFTVRETGTTEMYTIVQWNIGTTKIWNASVAPPVSRFPVTTDYRLDHLYNIPEWAIDRLETNPRYHDGIFTLSADGKTATTDDAPTSRLINTPDTHKYASVDWDTRLHLNCDVPASVTIKRKEGSPPVYDIVIGVLAPPEPLILDSAPWNIRILQVKDVRTGNINVTNPATFAGP